MDKILEINEQFTRRFSSGCIFCGKGNVWRFKLLDPENRPLEICVNCAFMQKRLRTKPTETVTAVKPVDTMSIVEKTKLKEEENVRESPDSKRRVGRPKKEDKGTGIGESTGEGTGQAVGNKPEGNVE